MANVSPPARQRHDWQRWLRHDAHRFVKPEPIQRKSYAERHVEQQRAQEEAFAAAEEEALRESLLTIRRELAELKFKLAFRRIFHKYHPDQPRVPKGDPRGGQWSKEGGGGNAGKEGAERALVTEDAAMRGGGRREPGRIPKGVAEWLIPKVETSEQELARVNRLANDATEKVQKVDPGWQPKRSLYEVGIDGDIRKAKDLVLEAESRLVELGYQSPQQLIQIYRAQHNALDLFGNPTWPFEKDVVATTIFDGVPIFGTNSKTDVYTLQDERTADAARDIAIAENPALPRGRDRTQVPNDAFYHAEATVLLRAARANGGSLEGRMLEIHVDAKMCEYSCPVTLPILSRQLRNPTITFIDKFGARSVLRGGQWD